MSVNLIDPEAAAKRLGTSRSHVMSLGRRGALPRVRVGRLYKFDPEDVEEYIARNKQAGTEKAGPSLGQSLGRVTRS